MGLILRKKLRNRGEGISIHGGTWIERRKDKGKKGSIVVRVVVATNFRENGGRGIRGEKMKKGRRSLTGAISLRVTGTPWDVSRERKSERASYGTVLKGGDATLFRSVQSLGSPFVQNGPVQQGGR